MLPCLNRMFLSRILAHRLVVLALSICFVGGDVLGQEKKKPKGKGKAKSAASLAAQSKRKAKIEQAAGAARERNSPPAAASQSQQTSLDRFTLDYKTPTDSELQKTLEAFDLELRGKYAFTTKQTAVGLLDLKTLRLALINPDRGEYVASIAQLGILLAYFHMHPQGGTNLSPTTRYQLGQMVKDSNNEMASMFSLEIGLIDIQKVLNSYGFYDRNHGGGLWMGKHFAPSPERYGDPIDDHSHAATVRQLMRYYLLLEQGKLVSPESSRVMRDIFATPEIPHQNNKFVKALAGRDIEIIRKLGSWKNYLHDSAVIKGKDRHYILIAFTTHLQGNKYLEDIAGRVDDLMIASAAR